MPAVLRGQDTFYVGTLKGVGRIYQQTFIDTYAKVAFAKLHDRKTPLRQRTCSTTGCCRSTRSMASCCAGCSPIAGEYCGLAEHHDYELYVAVENIDHTRTKARSPQTNGICERFHKTALNEFYRVAFRKKLYATLEELQADLDAWLSEYNEQRPHQGRSCYGKTPRQTFVDTLPVANEKLLVA